MLKVAFITNIYKEEEKKEIGRLKDEIKKLGFENYEIFVNDGIADNRGYAYGVNQGIKRGLKDKADVFVIFNADISLTGLTKQLIVNGLTSYDVLGFAMEQDEKIYYGGEVDKKRLSGGLILVKPSKRYSNVDYVSGSLMFIKRTVIEKIGLWDENYFFYYDEVDYCCRAKKAGYKIGIDSQSVYEHFELSQYNPRKDYFLAKNRFKFFWKYSNFSQKLYEFIRSPKTLIELLPLATNMIKQSKFLTNFFSLNFSSLANKLFHFALFIFLVRTLPPEKYGIYVIVWAFIGFFTPLIDLGTTTYGLVYLPKQKQTMINNLISMRFYIAGLIFLATNLAALFLFKSQREIIIYIFLTSVVILSNVWSGSYLIINSIKEKIIKSSIVSLIFNFAYILTIIIGLLLKKELMTIFLIIFITFLLYTVINFFLVKEEIGKLRLTIDLTIWKKVLSKSYIFILISFVAGLYFKQDVFLLKYLKSESTVGIYSAGYKFLDALLLLAASYNITVTPIFSKLVKERHLLKKKMVKDFILLFGIGCLTVIFFYIFGPLVLPLILKGKYLSGIKIAQIVVLALPFILITSIFYNVLYAFDMAKYVFFVFLIQVIINLIFNLIFIPIYSYYAAAWITVFSEMMNMLLAFYFVKRRLAKL